MGIASNNLLETLERRRFQRVSVALTGRYMLESKKEYPCTATEMSPGDMLVTAPVKPGLGEKVVVYLDELGRFAGEAKRASDDGFAMNLELPLQKRDRLADQLIWFANRHLVALPGDRRHERIIPMKRRAVLRMGDGNEIIIKIKDLSVSGVALETQARPELGSTVTVGSTPGVVVRHFDGGFALEFPRPFAPGAIDESTRL